MKFLGLFSFNSKSGSVKINLSGNISYTCLFVLSLIHGPSFVLLKITFVDVFFKKLQFCQLFFFTDPCGA